MKQLLHTGDGLSLESLDPQSPRTAGHDNTCLYPSAMCWDGGVVKTGDSLESSEAS